MFQTLCENKQVTLQRRLCFAQALPAEIFGFGAPGQVFQTLSRVCKAKDPFVPACNLENRALPEEPVVLRTGEAAQVHEACGSFQCDKLVSHTAGENDGGLLGG